MAQVAEKMQTVLLSGSLARKFGRRHRMTTSGHYRDVFGYFRQFPGWEQHIMDSAAKGQRLAIFNGKENISKDGLAKPSGRDVIRIVPVLAGSKRAGLLQTIIGVVIFVASFFIPGMQGWGQSLGASLALGGALQMLSPQAKGLGSQDSPNNKASYSFNGPVNTTAQGNPVPLLYGRMIVGSAVISAGIYTENQM
ncbi:tail assembly protein [Pseudomonas viridiflava]|uniref:tail assembly protein n=1 Tax=Pseudomonas viridiflava TaxID=33069 RepID=UPI000F0536BE|nr:tail assembly protein [Pseudomonas viridiflava]